MKSFEVRMCRLDGQEPTARDRWMCFYRLWRLLRTDSVHREHAATDCLRVFFWEEAWVPLVNAIETRLSRTHWPSVIRRRMVQSERRRRLFGLVPLERCQRVAADLLKQGKEVTPEEVAAVLWKIVHHMRERDRNCVLPQDDRALLEWIRSSLRQL